jgi:Tol biopolymer transport system component
VQTYQALPSPSFKGFAQSPADATVLVFGYTSQGGSTPSYALYKNSSVDITGAVPLTPVEFKSFGSIKITPDGTKVVFTASLGAGDSGVYVVGIDGSGLTKLDDADDADISPTGTRIVYTRFRPTDSHSEICAKNLDSSGFAQLTNNASDDILPQYSKDGTKIVFASDRVGGHFEIFSMTSAGASQTKLTTDSDADFGATFSPDASQIAYTRISTDTSLTGVYKKAATTATATALLYASPGIDLPIYWTPATTLRSRGPHGMPFTIGTSDRLKKRLGLIR